MNYEELREIVERAADYTLPCITEEFHLNMFTNALLARGVALQRWIPVTERLPEKGGYYLVNARFGITIMEFTMGNERYMEKPSFVSELLGRCNGEVTHWMPLPTPPKDGE